jgi:hypothetical protein
MADARYAKQNAVRQVLDYYLPSPHEAALGKQPEALERAKAECAAAYRRMAANVEALTMSDVFPKATT